MLSITRPASPLQGLSSTLSAKQSAPPPATEAALTGCNWWGYRSSHGSPLDVMDHVKNRGGFHGACQIPHRRRRRFQDFLSRGGRRRCSEIIAPARLPKRGSYVP